jgi:putative oxidoreductase
MRSDVLLLIGRILVAYLFVPAGYQTLSNVAGSTEYFARLGLPLPVMLAWAVGTFELIGGLAILLGYGTRLISITLALFAVAAGYVGHFGQGGDDPVLRMMHDQSFMKDMAVGGGLLFLAVAGAGVYAVDAYLDKKR